ncbi:hypothetical protein O3S80_28580 [Streptomyces sp. Lzd4kr]|nr:hypothetical protein [Streptomyces sp. Lzd4kr]
MDWTTLAGTALGALVGIGSTLLADRARWRRDLADRTRQERRQIYVTVLTKYRLAYEDMYAAAAPARGGRGEGGVRAGGVPCVGLRRGP